MAGYEFTIVCFANSRKAPAGRCIAGRVFVNGRWGEWIRPVSGRETRELMTDERTYVDGREPRLLDVMCVQLLEPVPHFHQTENHLIHPTRKARRVARVSSQEIEHAVEQPDTLWHDDYASFGGLNDRVPAGLLPGCGRSLFLIRPNELRFIVIDEQGPNRLPRRRVRAAFEYGGKQYRLSLTDPAPEKAYLDRPEGEYPIGEAIMCVSLSEAYEGFGYKLAATVITPRVAGVGV